MYLFMLLRLLVIAILPLELLVFYMIKITNNISYLGEKIRMTNVLTRLTQLPLC